MDVDVSPVMITVNVVVVLKALRKSVSKTVSQKNTWVIFSKLYREIF